jgi:uncharacterized Zn-finger protein
MPFSGDQLNLLNETNQNPLTESTQFEPLILQQLQSNFLLQDNLIPSSLIQLDDGTLLNVKTVNSEEGEELAHGVQNVSLPIEKPRNLECDICHKKYASKDVLRKHRKIHGIDKKFRCGKCEKGFDSAEELERHEKTHEGFRPYNCCYCANSFAKEHSLTTHLKRFAVVSRLESFNKMCFCRIHNISLQDNLLLYEVNVNGRPDL